MNQRERVARSSETFFPNAANGGYLRSIYEAATNHFWTVDRTGKELNRAQIKQQVASLSANKYGDPSYVASKNLAAIITATQQAPNGDYIGVHTSSPDVETYAYLDVGYQLPQTRLNLPAFLGIDGKALLVNYRVHATDGKIAVVNFPSNGRFSDEFNLSRLPGDEKWLTLFFNNTAVQYQLTAEGYLFRRLAVSMGQLTSSRVRGDRTRFEYVYDKQTHIHGYRDFRSELQAAHSANSLLLNRVETGKEVKTTVLENSLTVEFAVTGSDQISAGVNSGESNCCVTVALSIPTLDRTHLVAMGKPQVQTGATR